MSFTSPLLLWGLLSLLPLIAIYFLKVRPARKPVTAWFLWEKIFQERRARSLFQRFRDVFSLILLAIVFIAAVLAAARPFWTGDSRRDLVLIIDNSPSMNADDDGATRLDRAKAVAADIVRSLNGVQRCSIASIAGETEFLCGLTDNPRELLDAIESIEPVSLPSQLRSLTQSAALASADPGAVSEADGDGSITPGEQSQVDSSTGSSTAQRTILISDGCFDEELPESIELIKIGSSPTANVGIVACDMRRLPLTNAPAAIFCQVASTYPETLSVDLAISQGTPDNLIRLIPLEIEPGVNAPEIIQIDHAESGRWFFRLECDDALADDNQAFAALSPVVPIRVGVAAESRFFFETSVRAFSQGDQLLTLSPLESAQIAIGEGGQVVAAAPADTCLLIFNPGGSSPWWEDVQSRIAVTLPIVHDRQHPLLKYMDATAISWVGARKLKAPRGAEVLVSADDGTPLLYRLAHQGRRLVIVNMDPLAAEFFLSPWFPVLVHAAAVHLAGRPESIPATCATASAIPLPRPDEAQGVQWVLPDGSEATVTGATTGPLSQVGFHEFRVGDETWTSGCSLLSETETQLDNTTVRDTSQPVSRGWSPVGLLTALALALVVIESLLFHRRFVG